MEWLFGKSYWFEYPINEYIVGQALVIILFVVFCVWIVKRITRDSRVYNDTGFQQERVELMTKRDSARGTTQYDAVLKQTKIDISALRRRYTKRIVILSKIENQLNKLVDPDERRQLAMCIAKELGMTIQVLEVKVREDPTGNPWYVMRAVKPVEKTSHTEVTVVEEITPTDGI